jgi:1-acyl-sn-glycerol-3-phosphate acyltransferase
VRRTVGRAVVAGLRYRMVGETPPTHAVCVLVAAPHTSWLDFPLMLGMAWSSGLSPGFLAKQELFAPPFGGIMRRLGGIPVDRADPGTLVEDLVARARDGRPLALVVAPEGTRKAGSHWKSGFHRIARGADVPLVLTYLDGPSRTGGFGPTFHATDDLAADMARIRAFYADKRGVRPALRIEPVLRDEAGGGSEPVPMPGG